MNTLNPEARNKGRAALTAKLAAQHGDRNREIAELLRTGLSNAQIATKLSVSPGIVAGRRYREKQVDRHV